MKNFLLYLVLILLLATIALILIVTRSGSTLQKRAADFAIEDTARISKIFLADKNNRTVLLERQPAGNWKLNGKYRAHQENVDLLLKTMHNLAILEPVSEASYNTVLSVMAASAIKVEIYCRDYRIKLFGTLRLFPHEKKCKTYYVGHVTQNNIGTYMMMEKSSRPFIVYIPGFRGFVASRYRTVENDWREHTIFSSSIREIASVILDFNQEPEKSFRVEQTAEGIFAVYPLASPIPVPRYDTLKILDLLTSFGNIRFEGFVDDMDPSRKDTVLAQIPIHTITLELKDGTRYQAITYRKPGLPGEIDLEGDPVLFDRDRLYAVINNGQDIVLVQYFVFDRITRPLAYFLTD
jgi:hypothetical protein